MAVMVFSTVLVAHVHAGPTVPANTSVTNNGTGPTVPANTSVSNPAPANSVTTGETIANPLKYNSLEALLKGVLQSLITIGSILLTLALVWVGFKFVAARGNEEAIRSARTALMWTVIGGLILLGATAIETVISSTVKSITV